MNFCSYRKKAFCFRQSAGPRAGINIISTGFRHCSWDSKKLLIEQTIKKRRQNETRERGNAIELVKKPAFVKRERELELEREAKRQKLDEPGEQVSNLSFEGNEDKEKKTTVETGTQTEEFEYSLWLNDRQPVKVLKSLNDRQSDIFFVS